ncbi:organic cation transporter protein [Caerostris extrusa]|uniref:Organic cation transporter protein n=1 Tax=Caerostris extrusa TaxID=172846 RepID=A0AAV4TC13_CAEEX|nr:organic cation transporter protein [Caerostris extrusa]
MASVKANGAEAESVVKEYTDIIGGHGRYQFAIFMFTFFCSAAHCLHDFTMTFFAPNMDHWCARPPQVLEANISVELWKNISIPLVKDRTGHYEYSQCTMYNTSLQNGSLYSDAGAEVIKCTAWEYDRSVYNNTMVDEWNLVCDDDWLISMSKTIYMVAFLFSSSISGQLSDRFGRRRVMIGCVCDFLLFSFLTLLSCNILMLMLFRFFMALGATSLYTNAPVILAEILSEKYRFIYCYTYKYGWTIAYMLMPYIAWLVTDWWWLQLAFTVPWLSLLCVFWVVPETPRWLLTKEKFKELEELLLTAAKRNGKDMNQAKADISVYINYHSQIEHKEEENKTVLDLLRIPALRRNAFFLYFCWFINSYIYYALSYNTNDLGGNPYWNFFLSGAVEFPEGIIFVVLCVYIGTRYCLLIAHVMSGVCLIAMVCVPADIVWLTVFFSMAGKFFSSASFDTLFVYTPEIFPTVVRNVALGSGSTFARIGALIAPFVRQLSDVTYPWVPMAIPGAMAIFSGYLIYLLPETKGRALPDTLEEGERFAKNQEIRSKPEKKVSS